jgi:RNA polymerase sigma factor (sigma-70 family)
MRLPTPGGVKVEELFVSALPVVDELVRFVWHRGRGRRDEADEFASVVRLKLIERDYSILRRFEGRCSLRTYLSVTIQRLYLDFQRQRWGVWRPSAEANRLGETAIRLDLLLHRDGIPLEEAIETLRSNPGIHESAAELRGLAARLPCRRARVGVHADAAQLSHSAEDLVEGPALAIERHERAHALLNALQDSLSFLTPEDALVLRMRFGEGVSVAHIATILGIPSKPLYHRIQKLLAGLRQALIDQGWSAAEVSSLLGDPAFDECGQAATNGSPEGSQQLTEDRDPKSQAAKPPGSQRP